MNWIERDEHDRLKSIFFAEKSRQTAEITPALLRELNDKITPFADLVHPTLQDLAAKAYTVTNQYPGLIPFEDRFYRPHRQTFSGYSAVITQLEQELKGEEEITFVRSYVHGRRWIIQPLDATRPSPNALGITLLSLRDRERPFAGVELMINFRQNVRREYHPNTVNKLGIETTVQTAISEWIRGTFTNQRAR